MKTPDPPQAILIALAFLDDGESALSLERLTAVYLNASGALKFGLWPDRSRVAAEHRTIAARLARAAAANTGYRMSPATKPPRWASQAIGKTPAIRAAAARPTFTTRNPTPVSRIARRIAAVAGPTWNAAHR